MPALVAGQSVALRRAAEASCMPMSSSRPFPAILLDCQRQLPLAEFFDDFSLLGCLGEGGAAWSIWRWTRAFSGQSPGFALHRAVKRDGPPGRESGAVRRFSRRSETAPEQPGSNRTVLFRRCISARRRRGALFFLFDVFRCSRTPSSWNLNRALLCPGVLLV